MASFHHGEGNGIPLQYSYLKNPIDGGAWKAAVHGVAIGSDTTERLHFHFSLSCTHSHNFMQLILQLTLFLRLILVKACIGSSFNLPAELLSPPM